MKLTLPAKPVQVSAKIIQMAKRVGGNHAQLTKGAGVIAIIPRKSLGRAA